MVGTQLDDSSDDEEAAAKEVNHALKLQGFKVVEKGGISFLEDNNFVVLENGADCEFLSFEPGQDNMGIPANSVEGHQGAKVKFKKGHRRAWSMPNHHNRDKAVLVVAENNFRVSIKLE